MNRFLSMIFLLASCTTTTIAPNLKPLRNTHGDNIQKAISQYRAVLDSHGWEIEQSDGSGGFLETSKSFSYSTNGIMGKITALLMYYAKVSCYEAGEKVTCSTSINFCNNTAIKSGCRPITEDEVKAVNMESLLDDIKALGK